MPDETANTVMSKPGDTYKTPMIPAAPSGSSNGNSVEPNSELRPFLTPEQQTRILADLEPHRNKDLFVFFAKANLALITAGAQAVARIVLTALIHESDCETFIADIGEIKDQNKNLLDIFTHPAILERLKATLPDSPPDQFTLGGDQSMFLKATMKAWDLPYVGKGVSLLQKAINQMNETRRNDEYANFIPVVQSSGTGKSRLVDELARYVFTLPFNVRLGQHDATGYPKADPGILYWLNASDATTTQLRLRQTIFLGKLFEAVREVLASMRHEDSPKALATAFYNWLKDKRHNLYQDVINKAGSEFYEINKQVRVIKSSNLAPEQVIKKLTDLVDQTTIPALRHCRLLIEEIESKSGALVDRGSKRGPVRLVIYFDSAHSLTLGQPMSDSYYGKNFTAYQILCSTLNNFRKLDLFAIFLSTSSSLCVYSPPQVTHLSTRIWKAPFIELPFDLYDGKPLLFEHEHELQDVCKPKFMVRFGRPLFWTRYQCGDLHVKGDVVQFARLKLAPTRDKEAQIAILSVRLGLSFDLLRQQGRDIGKRLVEGYMHMAFGATTHGGYMYVAPPCEPILAEAAAQLMHERDVIENVVGALNEWCGDGLITKGQHGELAVLVILTKAHDWAIRLKSPSGRFSQPIRLPDYLVALVGETHAQKILDATPDNVPDSTTLAKSALGGALLHFTHWGKARDDSIVKDEAAWIGLCRGMAWKCSDQQKDIDYITPLLLWNEKLGRYTVSAIFWKTKNQSKPQEVHINAEELEFFTPHPNPEDRANSRPYLTIVLDLSARISKPRGSQKVPETQSTVVPPSSPGNPKMLPRHPRYAVTISGCSSTVYPNVIAKAENPHYASLLSSDGWFEEHPRRDPEFLEAIAQTKPTWGRGEGGICSYAGLKFNGPSRLVEPSPKLTKAEPITVRTYLDGTGGEVIRGAESGGGADDEGIMRM